MPDQNNPPVGRRWTVIASGLLILLLALVVIFTTRAAFFSPVAVVVVAAIGLVALLLQLRFYNQEHSHPVRAPVWLNLFGILFAVLALFADRLRLGGPVAEMMALVAIASFAISGALILHGFRKRRTASK